MEKLQRKEGKMIKSEETENLQRKGRRGKTWKNCRENQMKKKKTRKDSRDCCCWVIKPPKNCGGNSICYNCRICLSTRNVRSVSAGRWPHPLDILDRQPQQPRPVSERVPQWPEVPVGHPGQPGQQGQADLPDVWAGGWLLQEQPPGSGWENAL